MFAFEVQNLRTSPCGRVRAVFDLGLGERDEAGQFTGRCVVKDLRLLVSAKSGYWCRFPATLRRAKNREPVVDEQGHARYDTHVTLYRAEARQPTEAAVQFRDALADAAGKAFEAAGGVASSPRREGERPPWPEAGTAAMFRPQIHEPSVASLGCQPPPAAISVRPGSHPSDGEPSRSTIAR